MEGLLIFLLLTGLAMCIYFIVDSRGGTEQITTTVNNDYIMRLAISGIPSGTASIRSSWVITGQGPDNASFLYKRRPSIFVAFILFLFFIIPGILYLVFGGKSQVLNVTLFRNSDNTTAVQFTAQGGVARRKGHAFLQSIKASEPQSLNNVPGEEEQVEVKVS